jgi:hypothetical protein
VGCKKDNNWNGLKSACIFGGQRTYQGAMVPLVGTPPSQTTPYTYDRILGMVHNASATPINTGRNNNADPQDNKSFSIYGNFPINAGSFCEPIGFLFPSVGWSTIVIDSRNPVGIQFHNNGSISYPISVVTPLVTSGFLGTSRRLSSSFEIRRAGINSTVNFTSQTPANETFVLSLSAGQNINFYHIGTAVNLTALEIRLIALLSKL